VTLVPARLIDLPAHPAGGGFDHGDVHLRSGRVFVAHTAIGTVELIDGERGAHSGTIPDCPEASGVLCAQEERLVFAAARGAGRVLAIEAMSGDVVKDAARTPPLLTASGSSSMCSSRTAAARLCTRRSRRAR